MSELKTKCRFCERLALQGERECWTCAIRMDAEGHAEGCRCSGCRDLDAEYLARAEERFARQAQGLSAFGMEVLDWASRERPVPLGVWFAATLQLDHAVHGSWMVDVQQDGSARATHVALNHHRHLGDFADAHAAIAHCQREIARLEAADAQRAAS